MTRLVALLLLVSALGGTGCFVTESINQRPSIDIRQTSQTSGDAVYRGSTVTLEAEADDPEDHVVFFQWRAYLCTDATPDSAGNRPGCDAAPYTTAVLDHFALLVPALRNDEAVAPQVIFVILEAQDDYGAIARPQQELLIPVSDHAPELDLAMQTASGFVVGTPIEVYAKIGDLDDGADKVVVTKMLFQPTNDPAPAITDVVIAPPEQIGWHFTPDQVGRWELQVTATDPLGEQTQKSAVIDIVPDHAPCLAQYSPIAAPTGSAWPMTDPTLFQVSVVSDDLDPYPGPGAQFAWSIKQPGASTFADLGATGNSASLDPASYAPGDVVDLRVEIFDRNVTAITCDKADPTCSVISDDACIQRLTWRVEVH